ncbi:hypothetical protein DR192_05910 [Lawsonia intracellularis]|nr:hypothetical protein C4K43_00475 [Lawsonia intracellularis]RBN32478.1 hypothetical protein DR194_05900 [Lawsonia intracellularis]RBN34043.1 hypothetical protein DR192_05910 [Lawsonia intracellularis]RBN34643.1 hypothetical protein DR193_05905 [Lawsonia intracellularis]
MLIQHQNNINFFQSSFFLSYIPQVNVAMATIQLCKHVQSISSSRLQLAEQLIYNSELLTITNYNSYL